MDKGSGRGLGREVDSISRTGPTAVAATSGVSNSNSDTALTTPPLTQRIGDTTPGIGVTTPDIQVTTPDIGTTTPDMEATMLEGVTTPGIEGIPPGIEGTTPFTEAAATIKVLEALTAAVDVVVAASATEKAKEEEEHSFPQFPSDQDKSRKNKQTIKLRSVLGNASQRRQNKPQEEEFLRAVEAGDVPSVRRMLRNKRGLDVNCMDLLGRTPLRIAVQNENEEIVEMLLDRAGTRNMYESLLLAIRLDQCSIAMCILRHPMYTKVEQQIRLHSNDSIVTSFDCEDSLFEAETTPLILAAQRNSYEVLTLLLDRGARIEEPHDVSCDCSHCMANIELDDLRTARSRLNAYRGLTSEAYICLTSTDPILASFNLRKKLRKVTQDEKHYRDEYEALQKKLGQFVVRILDCVRGDEELDVLLNQGESGTYELLGRLNLAIRYNEKKFVAHSSCQKKLATMWYGQGLKYVNRSPPWARPIFVVVCGIMFPISSLIYFFAPTTKVRAFMQIPFIKFIHQSSSFFIFLVLICSFSLTEVVSDIGSQPNEPNVHSVYNEEAKTNLSLAGIPWPEHYRVTTPPTIFLILNVFVIGMIWQECKQIYGSGPKYYFRSMFNVMDTFSLSLYVTSFALHYVSHLKTCAAHAYLQSETGLKSLIAREDKALYHHYWMHADRYYWDAFDPMVVAEGLFAVANVVSFSRLFYLLAANEQLGPLQISLRSMIGDVSRFLAIFTIILVAFMVGLNNLYWYYEPGVRGLVELPIHEHLVTQAEEAFGTIEKTFTTVFWSIFGMGESSVVQLGDGFSGGFTERVGYIVYGLYNVVIVIILLNMLIAMMSRSFEAIADDQDIEWKFARAQLYMDFVQDGCTMPVPFNLLPSPKTLYRLGAALCGRCEKQQEPPQQLNNVRHLQENGADGTDYAINKKKVTIIDSPCSKSTLCQSEGKSETSGSDSPVKKIRNLGKKLYKQKQENTTGPTTLFEVVVKRLVKRYIFESEPVHNSPLEGDIEDLKQDLSGLRFELNNLISHHQRKTSSSVNLLSTKLEFLISAVVNQGGQAHTEATAPHLRIRPAKSAMSATFGLHNAVNLNNVRNQFCAKTKAKSRFSMLSPPHVSVTDEGSKEQDSVKAEAIRTENTTQAQQSKAKVNYDHRAKAVFRNVQFDNQREQMTSNRMVSRSQGNETSSGSEVKPQFAEDNKNLTVVPPNALQHRESYKELDVDSMEVTVILDESDTETDNSDRSGSYLEYSDQLEEQQKEDSFRYATSSDHHRGRPHQSTSHRDPNYSATYSVNRAGVHQFPSHLRSAQHSQGHDGHSTPTEQYTLHRQQNTGNVPGQHVDYGSGSEEEEDEQEEVYDFVNREGGHGPNEGNRGAYRTTYGQKQWMEHGEEHRDSMLESSDMSLNTYPGGQHHQIPNIRILHEGTAAPGGQERNHQSYVNEAYEEDCTESGSEQGDGTYASSGSFQVDLRGDEPGDEHVNRLPSHPSNSDNYPMGTLGSIDC